MSRYVAWAVVCFIGLCGFSAFAADWPAYLADAARSGVTAERLPMPLYLHWVHVPRHAPAPAWPAPAKQDIWHEIRELNPIVTYDRACHPVCVGDRVYFGSSADDQIYCLDAKTGGMLWSFFTEGPVRLAPTVAEGRVYFGSDDGYAYCLDAVSGALLWTFSPAGDARRIPGNGRIISSVPLRTGVVVDAGIAYFFAGLFPPDDVYRCALDAVTGKPIWCEKTDEVSPQGYLLASPTRLFVPSGRTAPFLFDRQSSKPLGQLTGPGGAYAVLVDDGVVSGPGRSGGKTIEYAEPGVNETIASFPGIRMVVQGDMAYLQSKGEISALNRAKYIELSRERNKYLLPLRELQRKREAAFQKKDMAELDRLRALVKEHEEKCARLAKEMDGCYTWKKPVKDPYAMILAGETLFCGGAAEVAALQASDGAVVWSAAVTGDVYGLCAANGRLIASSSDGSIYCFSPDKPETERRFVPQPEKPFSGPIYDLCDEAADVILRKTGITKGYCIVLGAGQGELAYALAQRSELNIIAVENDEKKTDAARKALDTSGLYGSRVAVHRIEPVTLPYTTYMANLVVSQEALVEGRLATPSGEIARILRPFGGTAIVGQTPAAAKLAPLSAGAMKQWLGKVEGAAMDAENGQWAVIRRGAVPGGGEWTQFYADPSHTACSMDQLREPMAVQWFGNPGPRDMIDRHHRPMSSLFKEGRLFVPADNRVIVVDAYNGSPLWELDAPRSRRVAAMKNSGHMLVTEEYLYIAVEGACWAVNVADGSRAFVLDVPRTATDKRDWGYLNRAGDFLIGTAQKPRASFDELSRDMVNIIEGDFRPVIISDSLFAVDRHTGKKIWLYEGGALMNSAITILPGPAAGRTCICFAESRNEKATANKDGRMRVDEFCQGDSFLVALDAETGEKIWERPIVFPFQHIMYLSGADGVLLATGSYNEDGAVYYSLFGFDAGSGKDRWQARYQALDARGKEPAELGGSHGEQWQHPVLINGTIYSRPYAFDLHTGEKKDYIAYRGGHGCGGLTGSAYYLYGRGYNPRMYPTDVKETEGIPLTKVSRPGCFLNMIPAGGLVLIPESSSGCTCAYPMQTSIAMAPASVLARN